MQTDVYGEGPVSSVRWLDEDSHKKTRLDSISTFLRPKNPFWRNHWLWPWVSPGEKDLLYLHRHLARLSVGRVLDVGRSMISVGKCCSVVLFLNSPQHTVSFQKQIKAKHYNDISIISHVVDCSRILTPKPGWHLPLCDYLDCVLSHYNFIALVRKSWEK